MIRQQKANLVILGHFRFQFPQGRADQLLHFQPMLLPERQGGIILRELFLIPIQIHLAFFADQVTRPFRGQDFAMPIRRGKQQGGKRDGSAFNLVPPGRSHKAQQPGHGAQPIARRDMQRAGRVHQHFRHLRQHAWHGERRHRPMADGPRIAGIGRAFLAGFQHQRLQPAPRQMPGDAEANNAPANNDRGGFG